MSRHKYYIAFISLLTAFIGKAQISPGDLISGHQELEGIANCTQCHDLGKQVSSAKCLACHEDIQSLMDLKRGFHSSEMVLNMECFTCHSEHHGKNFNMVLFDKDTFDHELTTYILEGQHAVIDCRACHKPEYIANAEIKERDSTYLGLSHDCISCHEDFHQGTLANNEDCASCHNIEAFRPAPGFDHDDSNYPLLGQHITVDCIECHQMTTKNGKEFQEFTGLVFNDCIACHDDSHNNQLPGTCVQCHSEEGFTVFIGETGFDHNSTQFQLKGSHISVSCYECHQQTSDPLLVFQDHSGVAQNDCFACHQEDDVHEGKLGTNCSECHTEESWLSIGSLDDFNHDLTDFPLVGKHVPVDCKECHTQKYTEPIGFSACMNCHDDYHEGEFAVNGLSPDCIECHSLNAGFEETTYTVEKHNESSFPLAGAHIATPCFACHISEERWTFRNIGSVCADCHDDVHDGQFEANGNTDCARCHDSETWFPSLFDHNNTLFALEGRHAEVECAACHKPYQKEGQNYVEYKIPNFECADCHLQ